MSFYRGLKSFLDRLYTAGGVLGALCLIAILCLIVVQMLARWFGWNVELIKGAPDYAGYCMAAASFLSFAYALNRGAHIRVTLFLGALGRFRYYGECWCFAIGAAAASYLAWYAVKATYWSHKLNDISQGQDATPLWIPQIAMCVGAVLLAICFWDNLVRLLIDKNHAISAETVQEH
ncbi:MAG: TRAP transporter small permease [Granulosicoccus sp.]|nr:TRAP transporter small permease [Granulosicoccus sp.]